MSLLLAALASGAFVYPDRFTVASDETLEQAEAKVTRLRNCARTWSLVGAIGGTALDVVTTQSNQRAGYQESNPLYGKHASLGELLAFHAASGGFLYWRMHTLARHDPAAACRSAKWVAGVAFLPGIINISARIRF